MYIQFKSIYRIQLSVKRILADIPFIFDILNGYIIVKY